MTINLFHVFIVAAIAMTLYLTWTSTWPTPKN